MPAVDRESARELHGGSRLSWRECERLTCFVSGNVRDTLQCRSSRPSSRIVRVILRQMLENRVEWIRHDRRSIYI